MNRCDVILSEAKDLLFGNFKSRFFVAGACPERKSKGLLRMTDI